MDAFCHKLYLLGLAAGVLAIVFYFRAVPRTQKPGDVNPSAPPAAAAIAEPLDQDSARRVTLKPFGIKITPATSPVQPERFSGYHTGVDFETYPSEADADVPVHAICTGKLVYKNTVSGYGGVAAQKCVLDGVDVNVLYGHLRLGSIAFTVGDEIESERQIGLLGKGFSAETDGERKHLHLGIHKGSEINFRGYVQSEAELGAWLDAVKYLRPASAD